MIRDRSRMRKGIERGRERDGLRPGWKGGMRHIIGCKKQKGRGLFMDLLLKALSSFIAVFYRYTALHYPAYTVLSPHQDIESQTPLPHIDTLFLFPCNSLNHSHTKKTLTHTKHTHTQNTHTHTHTNAYIAHTESEWMRFK